MSEDKEGDKPLYKATTEDLALLELGSFRESLGELSIRQRSFKLICTIRMIEMSFVS
ncbi:hypothetical protein [Paenibacillus sp.]|uniref:hypothetical protein n=1 Tax=Paenibacillus sp. TaxID=58172 RepID=UPI003562665A